MPLVNVGLNEEYLIPEEAYLDALRTGNSGGSCERTEPTVYQLNRAGIIGERVM